MTDVVGQDRAAIEGVDHGRTARVCERDAIGGERRGNRCGGRVAGFIERDEVRRIGHDLDVVSPRIDRRRGAFGQGCKLRPIRCR